MLNKISFDYLIIIIILLLHFLGNSISYKATGRNNIVYSWI